MAHRKSGAHKTLRVRFSEAAQAVSHAAGHPMTFLGAVLIVLVWAVTGPLFNYSDTWQLVINTGTTIVTFLMVFLIQNTQNRDTLALHLKLSELVFAVKGADNSYAGLENLSDEELEDMHIEFSDRAETALKALHSRSGSKLRNAATIEGADVKRRGSARKKRR